jgi:hypothetical protein
MMHNLQVTLVKLIEVIKTMINVPFQKVCESLELAYSTFMRWKSRVSRGEAPVKKPGPKKEDPLEVEGLMDRIQDLGHRKKRSLGVGILFEEYKDLVSRRSFQELVRLAREEVKREERALMRRIEWKQPGLVYSMDDTYFGRDEVNTKLHLHTVRDLASRYEFDPVAGEYATGRQVAKNLEFLFNRYGPPLFLKRNGGSNLKHHEVEDVLSRYMVIPLESPSHYPPYNGAREKGQSEMKQKIWRRQKQDVSILRRHFHVYAESGTHELNHLPRRCLKGRVSCQVFFSEKGGAKFSKRRRREIFEWIKKLSSAILVEIGKSGKRAAQTAWRMAVESWLHINGYIEVSMDGKVLPIFSPELSH